MAEAGTMRGKVLIQIGDAEPTEVCTVLIPLKATSVKQIGHSLHLEINTDLAGVPVEVEAKVRELLRFHNI